MCIRDRDIILQSTIKHKNDDALDWDLFLAPHHCSWTFFNENNDKDEPKDSSLVMLDYRRKGGLIIASSKKIENNDDNPPSHRAKEEYLKKLDKETQLLNTAVPVSYTHLDVYKRQSMEWAIFIFITLD